MNISYNLMYIRSTKGGMMNKHGTYASRTSKQIKRSLSVNFRFLFIFEEKIDFGGRKEEGNREGN